MAMSLYEKLNKFAKTNAVNKSSDYNTHRSCSPSKYIESEFETKEFYDTIYSDSEMLNSLYGIDIDKLTAGDVLFMDTETNGLSGGVGTIAFLLGVGYLKDNKFIVEQWLMRDFDEENDLLKCFTEVLNKFKLLVTYNGKSFDVPLLQNRFIMNSMSTTIANKPHADLRHISARLFKQRIGSCKLTNLEKEILDIHRTGDIPGCEIPERYNRYIKTKDFSLVEDVIEHNKLDIISLARLYYMYSYLYKHPYELKDGNDLLGMANSLVKTGNKNKAIPFYRLSADAGQQDFVYPLFASELKRHKKINAAIALNKYHIKTGTSSIKPYIALAKLYEHQLKDYSKAEYYTIQALIKIGEPNLLDISVQEKIAELEYRLCRIRIKKNS